MRVMGLTIMDAFSGADRAIFDGLKSRGLLAGIADGFLPNLWRYFFLVKSFRPNKRRWSHAWHHEMAKNPLAFHARTRSMDRRLRAALPTFDIVLQVGALFSPFHGQFPVPVTLFCDYTTKMAELNYPPWFGLAGSRAREWYKLETELYQKCTMIFTASENTRSSFVQHYGIAPSRVQVVGEGVAGVFDHPGKQYDERTILFTGIDFERKGGPTLLKAFEQVKARIPEAKLVIAGPQQISSQEGVVWLGHVTERERINQLFAEATVFAMPSVCEPFGLVLIEAMSHGLPVVGSTADAMPEIVEEAQTGFLVPVGDAEALADRLARLLSSPNMCGDFGQAGRKRVEKQFLWSQVVARIEDGLRQVCGDAG